jgi:hypothetical protein
MENAEHPDKQKNDQYTSEAESRSTSVAPSAMAVVTSSTAKQQDQDDYQNQQSESPFRPFAEQLRSHCSGRHSVAMPTESCPAHLSRHICSTADLPCATDCAWTSA